MDRRQFIFSTTSSFIGLNTLRWSSGLASALLLSTQATAQTETFEVSYSDEEWKKRLNPAAYRVLRHEGTERPFTSPLLDEHRKGVFACAGCALPLFSSDTKFDSHTGWPSFWKPLPKSIVEREDGSLGMQRTEVHCRRCGGHQGHVFDDGPKPTGLRYCINGVSLQFVPGPSA